LAKHIWNTPKRRNPQDGDAGQAEHLFEVSGTLGCMYLGYCTIVVVVHYSPAGEK
jgi:hypothetical protein